MPPTVKLDDEQCRLSLIFNLKRIFKVLGVGPPQLGISRKVRSMETKSARSKLWAFMPFAEVSTAAVFHHSLSTAWSGFSLRNQQDEAEDVRVLRWVRDAHP